MGRAFLGGLREFGGIGLAQFVGDLGFLSLANLDPPGIRLPGLLQASLPGPVGSPNQSRPRLAPRRREAKRQGRGHRANVRRQPGRRVGRRDVVGHAGPEFGDRLTELRGGPVVDVVEGFLA